MAGTLAAVEPLVINSDLAVQTQLGTDAAEPKEWPCTPR